MASDYLKAPTQEMLDNICVRFIEATNNVALRCGHCAICARETEGSKLSKIRLQEVVNRELLQPAVSRGGGQISIQACSECLSALKRKKLPRFSLANNMWIGDIPDELKNLTLPERC